MKRWINEKYGLEFYVDSLWRLESRSELDDALRLDRSEKVVSYHDKEKKHLREIIYFPKDKDGNITNIWCREFYKNGFIKAEGSLTGEVQSDKSIESTHKKGYWHFFKEDGNPDYYESYDDKGVSSSRGDLYRSDDFQEKTEDGLIRQGNIFYDSKTFSVQRAMYFKDSCLWDCHYENGVREGSYKEYYVEDKDFRKADLIEEGTFKADIQDGPFTTYYHGKVESKGHYEAGVIAGLIEGRCENITREVKQMHDGKETTVVRHGFDSPVKGYIAPELGEKEFWGDHGTGHWYGPASSNEQQFIPDRTGKFTKRLDLVRKGIKDTAKAYKQGKISDDVRDKKGKAYRSILKTLKEAAEDREELNNQIDAMNELPPSKTRRALKRQLVHAYRSKAPKDSESR